MSIDIIAIAMAWGIVSGYLLIRIMDSLVGVILCLLALINARWKRLAGKPSVNHVDPGIILRLMFQLTVIAVLCGFLFYYGYGFIRRESGFDYSGGKLILWSAMACATALSRLPATRRRLIFFWKMIHEFDYAQRRQRTFLLKS